MLVYTYTCSSDKIEFRLNAWGKLSSMKMGYAGRPQVHRRCWGGVAFWTSSLKGFLLVKFREGKRLKVSAHL